MTSYELWLFLHISATVVWLGGAVMGQIFGILTQRAKNPLESAAFGRNMAWTSTRVFLPASIVVILTGMALTEDLGWDWSEPFVLTGLVGGIAVALAAVFYLTPRMGAAGARLAAEGPTPAAVAAMNRLVWFGRGLILVLFVIVFMMVAKLGT
jgi:uncharacterized membrane protein